MDKLIKYIYGSVFNRLVKNFLIINNKIIIYY